MNPDELSSSPKLDDARRLWIECGGTVRHLRRTGEECYEHPRLHRRYIVNSRRKDAPRQMVGALRRIMEARCQG